MPPMEIISLTFVSKCHSQVINKKSERHKINVEERRRMLECRQKPTPYRASWIGQHKLHQHVHNFEFIRISDVFTRTLPPLLFFPISSAFLPFITSICMLNVCICASHRYACLSSSWSKRAFSWAPIGYEMCFFSHSLSLSVLVEFAYLRLKSSPGALNLVRARCGAVSDGERKWWRAKPMRRKTEKINKTRLCRW